MQGLQVIDDLRRRKMRKYRAWSFIRGTCVLTAILMVSLVGWAILVSLVVFVTEHDKTYFSGHWPKSATSSPKAGFHQSPYEEDGWHKVSGLFYFCC
jgi:hypothetical protein